MMLLSDITILYVEDEKHSRDILGLILKDIVKDIYLASNGEEALEIYKEIKVNIDIVLSDISMPILDGIEMSRRIKKINKSQPIILLTASQNYKYLEKAMELGIYRYMLKPILDIKRFTTVLQSVVDVINEEKYMNKSITESREQELIESDFYHPTILYKAYKNNEFEIHYQPQIDTITNKYIGVEALLRWNSEEEGLLKPNSFILGAIGVGMMVMIDEWVLEQSMRDIAKLYESGFRPGILSVNLMIRSLESKTFIDKLIYNIENIRFNPRFLEFKIREHDIILLDENLIDKIKEISSLGVKISIANFGKGFVTYIKKIPIDKIKINKDYISGLPNKEDNALIVKAIIELGKKLKIDIVAEGVETKEELKFLKENDCHNIQGYLYSKAVTLEKLKENLMNF